MLEFNRFLICVVNANLYEPLFVKICSKHANNTGSIEFDCMVYVLSITIVVPVMLRLVVLNFILEVQKYILAFSIIP